MATSTQYLQGAGGGISLQGSAPRLQAIPNIIQMGLAPTQKGAITVNQGKQTPQVPAYVDATRAENDRLRALAAASRPVSPASVDIAAINAQARRQAEESVNPLYTKKLNDMLARQAVQRQRAQENYTLGIQNAEEQLKQLQEGNVLERERVTEDVATDTAQLNTSEDQFQTMGGQQFDDQRLAEAGQLAAAGLTASGLGRQQAERSIEQRNVSEKQQGEEFQAQRTAQAVFKARTFEDLAKSDVLAGQRAEKGRQSVKLDLDRLIEDVNSEESASRFNIEQQRVADIAGRTSDYSRLAFNNYLASIRDPRVLAATAQAYGGLF